jgi:putative ABC transport system permease protein
MRRGTAGGDRSRVAASQTHLLEMLDDATSFASRITFVAGDSSRTLTLGDLWRRSRLAASGLRALAGTGAGAVAMLLELPAASAGRLGVGVGDEVVLATVEGDVPFRIVATADVGSTGTTVITSNDAGGRYFAIDAPRDLLVGLAPRADRDATAAAIEDGLADRATFLVSTFEDERADVRAQLGGAIDGFFVLLLLAGAMGVLGLANTMAVTTLQRTRELAVIRGLGARRAQVRSMILMEASTLVAVACLLGVLLGALVARPVLAAVVEGLGDLTIHYHVPWPILPVIALAAVVAAGLAAVPPIRRVNVADIEQAMRVE